MLRIDVVPRAGRVPSLLVLALAFAEPSTAQQPVAPSAVAPQPFALPKVELHALETLTLTDEEFLRGDRDRGRRATIAAALRIPPSSEARLPAIVLMPGSLGIRSGLERWAQELNELGIATMMVDTFTGRGIGDTVGDQFQLGALTTMYDAYRALELLAKHPRIDPQRIGILGGSRGGGPALYSSMTRFQRMYATPGTRFAVHLVFYTGCSTTYLDDTDVGAPIRIFHGTADDAGPIEPCRAYVERLRAASRDARLHEYVGAHHGFDVLDASLRIRLDQRETPAFCVVREGPVGHLVNVDTVRPLAAGDACIRRGVTLAGDAEARAAAAAEIRRILVQLFELEAAP